MTKPKPGTRVAKGKAPPRVALPKCEKKTREGAKYPLCQRPAGWGTNHPGTGPCKLHGGVSGTLKSGRYATMRNQRVRDLIEHHEQDPDPLNIYPELAAARGIFVDFIDRHGEFTEALLAWHESYEAMRIPLPEDRVMAFEGVVNEWEIALREGTPEATERQLAEVQGARAFLNLLRGHGVKGQITKPRTILDISDAYRIVSEITKIAERIWKRAEANAISRKDLTRVMEQMGRDVMKYVTDTQVLANIRKDWLSIGL